MEFSKFPKQISLIENKLKYYGMLKMCQDCIHNKICPQYEAPGLKKFTCYKKEK